MGNLTVGVRIGRSPSEDCQNRCGRSLERVTGAPTGERQGIFSQLRSFCFFRLLLSKPALPSGREGLVDDALEQIRETFARIAGTAREFLHLGEAQLRVGEGEASFRLGGGGRENVRLILVLNLHTTTLQQFQFAIERAKSDPEFAQNRLATAGTLGQEHDESVESRGASQGDMGGGATSGAWGSLHGASLCETSTALGRAKTAGHGRMIELMSAGTRDSSR